MSSRLFSFLIYSESDFALAKEIFNEFKERSWGIFEPKGGLKPKMQSLTKDIAVNTGLCIALLMGDKPSKELVHEIYVARSFGLEIAAVVPKGEGVPEEVGFLGGSIIDYPSPRFFENLERFFVHAVWEHPFERERCDYTELDYDFLKEASSWGSPKEKDITKCLKLPLGAYIDAPFHGPMSIQRLKHIWIHGPKEADKTSYVKTLLLALLLQNNCRTLRVGVLDFDDELACFDQLKNLKYPRARDVASGDALIGLFIEESLRRLQEYDKADFTRDIEEYYAKTGKGMPYMVLVCHNYKLGTLMDESLYGLTYACEYAGIYVIVTSEDEPKLDKFDTHIKMTSKYTPIEIKLAGEDKPILANRPYLSDTDFNRLLMKYIRK